MKYVEFTEILCIPYNKEMSGNVTKNRFFQELTHEKCIDAKKKFPDQVIKKENECRKK